MDQNIQNRKEMIFLNNNRWKDSVRIQILTCTKPSSVLSKHDWLTISCDESNNMKNQNGCLFIYFSTENASHEKITMIQNGIVE